MAKTSFYADSGTAYAGLNPTPLSNDGEIVIIIDGMGSLPTTGDKADLPVMFDCTINSLAIVADQVGSAVVDILKAPIGTTPTISICGSDLPTLASASSNSDTLLTGWTTSITAGDVLRFNLNSVSTITRLTLVLKITKI